MGNCYKMHGSPSNQQQPEPEPWAPLTSSGRANGQSRMARLLTTGGLQRHWRDKFGRHVFGRGCGAIVGTGFERSSRLQLIVVLKNVGCFQSMLGAG